MKGMKGRLLEVTFIFTVLGLITLPVPVIAIGWSERYPTQMEIQQLVKKFLQQASQPKPEGSPCCLGSERDPRSATTKRKISSFVKGWGKINPDIAPFTGRWINNNAVVTVYPTKVKGRVCVILSGVQEDFFTTGLFSQGHIKLQDGELAGRALILQRNKSGTPFLLSAGIYANVPNFTIYGLAYTPDAPAEFLSPATKANILQQFKLAGCSYTSFR